MNEDAYNQVVNAPHKAKLSHELIAAAASFEAMKTWNEHKTKNGEQVNHAMAKEILAAASGAFIDRMIETKGLDAIDKYKVKQQSEGHHDEYLRHHHHH
ncbi:hypothetical protein J3R82DRAFT_9324 [Butyriboletus roseoflavus]|nr:hypothetical protein J3R82DRAFT_9324 [Butyriboletus roseoflavus]